MSASAIGPHDILRASAGKPDTKSVIIVRMVRPGLKVIDLHVGEGELAERTKVVSVRVRTYLIDGTDVTSTGGPGPFVIDLRRRDCIAGLRYGIEGMRVGGVRELTIEPHLAYGPQGVPGSIPQYATLRCEVELLDVRDRGVVKPDDYPPGRQLVVGDLGCLRDGLPRWQFGLHEDGRYGITVQFPIPNLKWRHVPYKHVWKTMPASQAQELLNVIQELPTRHPEQCLAPDAICVDHSGHDGGVHRTRQSDALCLAVTMFEQGHTLCQYYIEPGSPAWESIGMQRLIRETIASLK
jgi:FKBP-type peptidyl-prolyl cis-trans isomerase FkpA